MKLAEKNYRKFIQTLHEKLNRDVEYKKAEKEYQHIANNFKDTLSEKQKELFNQYDDATVNLDSIVARIHYICGFWFGRKHK